MTGLAAGIAAAGRTVRKAAGRRARDNGESLERALDAYHADLAARGVAWVRRVGAPVAVLGKVSVDPRGRHIFRAAFDGKQGVDFVGHTRSGIHVAIEAKSHASESAWDCGIDPVRWTATGNGALQHEQWEELWRVDLQGGLAVIVLRAWGMERFMSPRFLAEHVRKVGRRTVRPDEIDAIAARGLRWGG